MRCLNHLARKWWGFGQRSEGCAQDTQPSVHRSPERCAWLCQSLSGCAVLEGLAKLSLKPKAKFLVLLRMDKAQNSGNGRRKRLPSMIRALMALILSLSIHALQKSVDISLLGRGLHLIDHGIKNLLITFCFHSPLCRTTWPSLVVKWLETAAEPEVKYHEGLVEVQPAVLSAVWFIYLSHS